jgi:peptidoglycan/LPS O-acetylase OafA/YrhL
VYTLPTSWSIVMVIGAAAACYQSQLARLLPSSKWPRGALSLMSVGVLLLISFSPVSKSEPMTYLLLGPVIGVCTVVVIFHLKEWKRIPTQWLRPLLGLGTISYAAYLWNYPIMNWLGGPNDMTIWRGAFTIIVTIAAATISWWAIERWTGYAKRWFDDREAPPLRPPSPRIQNG